MEFIKYQLNTVLNDIVNQKGDRTFDNTIRPYIKIATSLYPLISSFTYASNFYEDKNIRNKGNELKGELSKFLIECSQRKDMYNAALEYQCTNYPKEKETLLSDEEIRYFEHQMRDYKREGLQLDDDEFVQMKKQLSDLKTQFNKNLNEENTSFEYTTEQLDGLPESWFTEERKVKDKDNTYKMTLKYPDYVPAIKYIKDENIRKELYLAFQNRCADVNTQIFEKAVKLRCLIAKRLGYATHADFATEVKIVKNSKNAIDFETNLDNMFTPLYEKDMAELLEFAKKDRIERWDELYYIRLFEEEKYNVNHEEIKKYFPLDVVKNGLFKIYQDLLNLTFTQLETDNIWHEDVTLYQVNDKDTNELLGYFYLDMFPREGKYAHAAAFDFMPGCDMTKLGHNSRTPNIISMVCNFPKNECISFDDVVTFFHEFGHVMHYICGKPELADFNSFNVEWDFVEAPSQMLEFWCYCAKPLELMSKHKETGKPIPIELVRKIKEMKNSFSGRNNKRQLLYGIFDLEVHSIPFNSIDDTFDSVELWAKVEEKVYGKKITHRTHQVGSFGHIMGGYDAGYYGYLRSLTFATNMFYLWFKDGHVMDKKVGLRYRTKLCEPGSSKDGIELLTDFLGQEPSDDYFLMDKGLQLATE